MTNSAADDRRWLEQALALGATAEWSTRPNPRVGCVVVADGVVVGAGAHRRPGGPHAEALALDEAGPAARGATLYVNLEPCAHTGRTPPCTERIIDSGVRRVVASIRDPNPRVDGRGFARLREAGVAVDVGLHEPAAREMNLGFHVTHESGRPAVTIKAAATLDGMLAARDGRSRWITGPEARRFAHRLRAAHDAVLVGAATVRLDDPRLDVRLPECDAAPRPVVLAPRGEIDPGARVLGGGAARARVYVTDETSPAIEALEARAERFDVVRLASDDPRRLPLDAVLADLAAAGVQSVLVEGGGRTISSFLEARLAERAAIFVAGRLLGAHGGVPLVAGRAVGDPSAGWSLDAASQFTLGDDVVWLGRLHAPAA